MCHLTTLSVTAIILHR